MGFLSDFFKKGEDPEQSCADTVLGSLLWSEDDEAWFGEFNGHKFGLSYEGLKKPSEAVVSYAREILNDSPWLSATLAEAKKKKIEKYGRKYGDQYKSEVESLSFGRIVFYIYKGKRRIMADLEGGNEYRLWRIEYNDRNCEGIGFDS